MHEMGLRRFGKGYSDKRSLILETNKFEYMKALSDVNGMDIKHHEDNPIKLITAVKEWFSETLSVRHIAASTKIFDDFITFNTTIFERRFIKHYEKYPEDKADDYATAEISELTIPDFIDEIKDYLK